MRVENVLKENEQGVLNDKGNFVRKGTIYTMLLNAKNYEDLCKAGSTKKIEELIEDIKVNVENLANTGIFDFFEPLEWFMNNKKEGRIITALIYCKMFPRIVNKKLREVLSDLENNVSQTTKAYLVKVLELSI